MKKVFNFAVRTLLTLWVLLIHMTGQAAASALDQQATNQDLALDEESKAHYGNTYYGKTLVDVGNYIRNEVDVTSPAGKRVLERYNSLKTRDRVGKLIGYPFACLGLVGLGIAALVAPDSDADDHRTEEQKTKTLQLGFASLASIGLGFGLGHIFSAKDDEIESLFEASKKAVARSEKVSSSDWTLRGYFSLERQNPSFGLSLNF